MRNHAHPLSIARVLQHPLSPPCRPSTQCLTATSQFTKPLLGLCTCVHRVAPTLLTLQVYCSPLTAATTASCPACSECGATWTSGQRQTGGAMKGGNGVDVWGRICGHIGKGHAAQSVNPWQHCHSSVCLCSLRGYYNLGCGTSWTLRQRQTGRMKRGVRFGAGIKDCAVACWLAVQAEGGTCTVHSRCSTCCHTVVLPLQVAGRLAVHAQGSTRGICGTCLPHTRLVLATRPALAAGMPGPLYPCMAWGQFCTGNMASSYSMSGAQFRRSGLQQTGDFISAPA